MDYDNLLVALWEGGTVGIIEASDSVRAFFADKLDCQYMAALTQAHGQLVVQKESTDDEQLFTQDNWEPILVGERFYVAPPWLAATDSGDRLRLEIDAATAFGTGRHETTQLCLKALERVLRVADTVLDVGCGSGILSAAAYLLGARHILSCDIHEDVIATARKHVKTPIFLGSADNIANASVDLVVANISAKILDVLAFDLKRITRLGGRLILSGFMPEKPPLHYHAQTILSQGDWLCWICEPEAITPASDRDLSGGLSHTAEWWL